MLPLSGQAFPSCEATLDEFVKCIRSNHASMFQLAWLESRLTLTADADRTGVEITLGF